MIPVVIIRHPKEKLRKCTLRPLQGRSGFAFYRATQSFSFDATGHILLSVDAPPLTRNDASCGHPLLLLDSTWRLLDQLEGCLTGSPIRRSIPAPIQTAYPRKSKTFSDPVGGLASIEALYAALWFLGEADPSILDDYHWKNVFLDQFQSG